MRIEAIRKSYARWAPIYDRTFGMITNGGRTRAAHFVNTVGGSVLEVGIGTGLALTHYAPKVKVTGIDLSNEMLDLARAKAKLLNLKNVALLAQMNAEDLQFDDESFDHVVAMHIMSVVPQPEQVLSEMVRVCRIGGSVMIANHVATETGIWFRIEKLFAPLADYLGWHSDFALHRLMGDPRLRLEEKCFVPPLRMMTYLRFRRIL